MDRSLAVLERSLDERARALLREVPIEVATKLLRECRDKDVRNPSAYIFVAARKARPSRSMETLEDLQADLDENAMMALRELPPEQTNNILDELADNWDAVRNRSAYVTAAARNCKGGAKGIGSLLGPSQGGPAVPLILAKGPAVPPMAGDPMGSRGALVPVSLPHVGDDRRPSALAGMKDIELELESIIAKFALDEAANDALHRIPLDTATEILRSLDHGVRNPSAFVMSRIKLLPSDLGAAAVGPSAGRGLPGVGDSVGSAPVMSPPPGPPPETSLPDSGDGDELERWCDAMLDQFCVDDRCRSISREVPRDTLREIIEQLGAGSREVRNPSAFIFQACVNYQKTHPPTSSSASLLGQPVFSSRPGATHTQVDEAIERFQLDSTASIAVRALDPEHALGILDQISDNIKNKSAFVTTAAKRISGGSFSNASPSGTRGERGSHQPDEFFSRSGPRRGHSPDPEDGRVETLLRSLDLDDRACKAVCLLGRHDALDILQDLRDRRFEGGLSQLAYTAARRRLPQPDLEEAARRYALDETAINCLKTLLPNEVKEVLGSIDGGIRNPSAFVSTTARRLHQDLIPCDATLPSSSGGGADSLGLPPGLSRQELEDEVEAQIRRMDLDERTTNVLHEVPLDKAIAILGEVKRMWSTIRNPSAYVFHACVKELNAREGRESREGQPYGSSSSRIDGITRGDPQAAKDVERAIAKWNLDDTATGALLKLHPEQALDILGAIDSNVRNPSAFVTTAARKRGEGTSGVQDAAMHRQLEDQVENLLKQVDVDEKAIGVLREIPVESALEILGELTRKKGEVRNPSAYAFQAAIKAQERHRETQRLHEQQAVHPADYLEERLQAAVRRFKLDQTAVIGLRPLPPAVALSILDQLSDEVRDPSEFVSTMARRALPAAGTAGFPPPPGAFPPPPSGFPPGVFPPPPPPGGCPPGFPAAFPPPPNVFPPPPPGLPPDALGGGVAVPASGSLQTGQQEIGAAAEHMARDLGIDDNALAALQTVPLEHAMAVLSKIRDGRPTMRNPSSYIMSVVKEWREKQRMGPGAPPMTFSGNAGQISGERSQQLVRQVDSMIARLGLDKTAVEALRACSAEEAIAVLNTVDSSVRNPSAWVTNAARNARERSFPAFPGAEGGSSKRLAGFPDEREEKRSRRDQPWRDAPWTRLDLKSWLEEIDDGNGFLIRYEDALSKHYDTIHQVIDIYARRSSNGTYALDEALFADLGVEKVGHRRLFERWFDRNLNP